MSPVEWTSHAHRQFRKLPAGIQRQILSKLDDILAAPNPLSYAEPLTGHRGHVYRFRSGDYRVIVERETTRFLVLAVGHRREVYR